MYCSMENLWENICISNSFNFKRFFTLIHLVSRNAPLKKHALKGSLGNKNGSSLVSLKRTIFGTFIFKSVWITTVHIDFKCKCQRHSDCNVKLHTYALNVWVSKVILCTFATLFPTISLLTGTLACNLGVARGRKWPVSSPRLACRLSVCFGRGEMKAE